jgi:hypothetical protein
MYLVASVDEITDDQIKNVNDSMGYSRPKDRNRIFMFYTWYS